MIKVFMVNGEDFGIELDDEAREINIVTKFQEGISPSFYLKYTTASGKVERIHVSQINNMQFIPEQRRPMSLQEAMREPLAWMFDGQKGHA